MINNYTPKNNIKSLLTFLFLTFNLTLFYAQSGDLRQDCVEKIIFDHNGYTYELWQSDVAVYDGCMTTKNNGDFYIEWTTMYNTLARKGLRPGQPNNTIDFYVNNQFNEDGNVFYGAYGWWRNPSENGYKDLVEYYVVENYGVNKPTDNMPYFGDIYSDGAMYEIYIGEKTGQPSIDAQVDNFTQIKAIRKEADLRFTGTINMVNHFNEWAGLGYVVDDLFEVSMKIEGFSGDPIEDPNFGNAYVTASMSNAGTFSPNHVSTAVIPTTISGTYLLKAEAGGRYATSNNTNWATVKETQFETWSSQHWTLEHVSGDIYRLKEEYGGRYLSGNATTESVEVSDLDPNGGSQKWELEQVGNNYRLKCQWGGKYLTSPDENWGSLSVETGSAGSDREWTLEVVTGAKSLTGVVVNTNNNNLKIEKKISVYPNPSNGFINLSISGYNLDKQASAVIYDMQGREVIRLANIQEATSIYTNNLARGSYFIQIYTDKELETIQFYNN